MIVAIAAGLVLGVASKAVNAVAPAWAGNSLALWLLVAFLVGLGASSRYAGALRGCVALVVANCAYYAWRLFVTEDIGLRFTLRAFAFWTAGGFAGEAAFTAANGGHGAHVAVAGVIAAGVALRTAWTRTGAWIALAAFVAVAGAAALRRVVLP